MKSRIVTVIPGESGPPEEDDGVLKKEDSTGPSHLGLECSAHNFYGTMAPTPPPIIVKYGELRFILICAFF